MKKYGYTMGGNRLFVLTLDGTKYEILPEQPEIDKHIARLRELLPFSVESIEVNPKPPLVHFNEKDGDEIARLLALLIYRYNGIDLQWKEVSGTMKRDEASAPAWLHASPWATDPQLAPVLTAEAAAFNAWLHDGRIPVDRVAPKHVAKYLGKPIDITPTDGVLLALRAWQKANAGRMMFPEMAGDGIVAVMIEGLERWPRALRALHPDLYFFTLAWGKKKI